MGKLRFVVLAVLGLGACGDDDGGTTPLDMGPTPDQVAPPPPMDAGPDTDRMDAGPMDTGPMRPDLGPLDAGPGLGQPSCDPRDPASCPEGESCKALYGAAGAQFTCRFGGAAAEGEPCTFMLLGRGQFFVDNCLGGLWCTEDGEGAGLACRPICGSPDDCATGEICRFVARGVPPFPYAGMCRAPDDCDATTGAGCPSGETCIAVPDFELQWGATYCEPVGPLGEGEVCGSTEVCGEGLTCSIVPEAEGGFVPPDTTRTVLVPSRCQRLCDATDPEGAACSDATTGCVSVSPSALPGVSAGLCRLPDPEPIGPADRPARVVVPASYDGETPMPLVVLLHGMTGTGPGFDAGLRFTRLAHAEGFLGITPSGLRNADDVQYWNVHPVVCTEEPCPDDSAYILGLIEEMKTRYRVEADRVYLLGVSNGAYLAYRIACDGADVITAVASLAGSTPVDETTCNPARPVSVLAVHGDADTNVTYVASANSAGAVESVEEWATRAGCDVTMPTMGEPFDMDTRIEGDETTVRRYTTGCMPGLDAELWTVVGGDHFMFGGAADDFSSRVVTWLLRHTR